MGLLPMGADILPPSDDRVFKLILTSPEAKQGLMNLISSIIGRTVVDVVLLPNELAPGDTEEKAERFDVNCKIDDGSQVNLEMQASYMVEDLGGQHLNLKGKSIYYLTDLHSSQPAKGLRRYDRLARSYQITFCSYTIFPNTQDYVNSFSLRHDTTGELLSDAINLTFVELSKLDEVVKKPVSDMTDLDKWSVFFQYAPDMEHREIVNKVIESEDLLKNSKPQMFLWLCFGIPAVIGLVAGGPVGSLLFGLVFGHTARWIAGGIIRNKYIAETVGRLNGKIDINDLLRFLNEYLNYLYPYFHEGKLNAGVLRIPFGIKQKSTAIIHVIPDKESAGADSWKYVFDAENDPTVLSRIIGITIFSVIQIYSPKHTCLFKTVPILQAAMEYYLKQYREGTNHVLS